MRKYSYITFLLIALPLGMFSQDSKVNHDLIQKYAYSHDLNLPDWGPYSKKYNGISHVTSKEKGYRFDLSFAAGYFHRSKMVIPDVIEERDYFIWDVDPDLKYLSYNYQLEWKDKVTCDVVFSEIDNSSRYITVKYTNNSATRQDVVYNLLASMNYPRQGNSIGKLKTSEPVLPVHVTLPNNAQWVDGMDYKVLDYATPRFDDNLIYDGFSKGELYGSGLVNARALARNFGVEKGDKVTYTLEALNQDDYSVVFRYKNEENEPVIFSAQGILNTELEFQPSKDFSYKTVKLDKVTSNNLTLTSAKNGTSIILDGFAIVPALDVEKVTFQQEEFTPIPKIIDGPTDNSVLLKYENTNLYYGMVWEGPKHYKVEIHSDKLTGLPQYNNRNIDVAERFENNRGHFTDILVYDIALMPFSKQELNGMVVVGSKAEVEAKIKRFQAEKSDFTKKRDHLYDTRIASNDDNPYSFAMKRMESVMANNLVFPIICQNEYIKHYTPGRRWNSLYTWDVGMIGIGYTEMDIDRARKYSKSIYQSTRKSVCLYTPRNTSTNTYLSVFRTVE